MVCHTWMSNAFISDYILLPTNHYTTGSSAVVIPHISACIAKVVRHSSHLLGIVYKPYLASCDTVWGFLHGCTLTILTPSFYCLSIHYHQFLLKVFMLFISNGFATGANLARIAQFRVPAYQTVPTFHIHIATSRRTKLLLSVLSPRMEQYFCM